MIRQHASDQLNGIADGGLISKDLADRIYVCEPISELEQNQVIAIAAECGNDELHDFMINYQTFMRKIVQAAPGIYYSVSPSTS